MCCLILTLIHKASNACTEGDGMSVSPSIRPESDLAFICRYGEGENENELLTLLHHFDKQMKPEAGPLHMVLLLSVDIVFYAAKPDCWTYDRDIQL